jgi:hypothetical protein
LSPIFGSVFQSIFPLFLDFARSVSCLFYCAFRPSRWIWGRFLDLFWAGFYQQRLMPFVFPRCSCSSQAPTSLPPQIDVYRRATLHRYLNFIAVLGYPLGDDPCPISKRVDLRRNWGSGRPTFLVISTLRLLIDPRPRRGQGNRYPGQSKGGYLWQAS